MNRYLPMLADRVLGQPLLLTPQKAATIIDVLSGRIGLEPSADSFVAPRGGSSRRDALRKEGSTAIIAINGSMVNRGAWLDASSGLVSYEGIAHQMREALNDEAVNRIVLDINTSGGEAAGCAELGDLIFEVSSSMETVAVVNSCACSAGYWIASQCGEIIIGASAQVGSIGVVAVHMDHSEFLKNEGIKPTIIHQGARKADGNPFEALSDEALKRYQDDQAVLYADFCEAVGRGRGARFSATQAKATEALVYRGQKAVDIGLADRVGTFADVIANTFKDNYPSEKKETVMSDKPKADEASATASEAELSAARLEGATVERARIQGIYEAGAKAGHDKAALELAFSSPSATAEMASAMLSNIEAPKPETGLSVADRAAQADGFDHVAQNANDGQPVDPWAEHKAAWANQSK